MEAQTETVTTKKLPGPVSRCNGCGNPAFHDRDGERWFYRCLGCGDEAGRALTVFDALSLWNAKQGVR